MIISVIMFIYVCMCKQVIICNKKHMLVPYIVYQHLLQTLLLIINNIIYIKIITSIYKSSFLISYYMYSIQYHIIKQLRKPFR